MQSYLNEMCLKADQAERCNFMQQTQLDGRPKPRERFQRKATCTGDLLLPSICYRKNVKRLITARFTAITEQVPGPHSASTTNKTT